MTVSNKHIILEQKVSDTDGRRVVVMHENSSNGTVVNGVQYNRGQTVELTPGAEISFPCEDATKNDKKQEFTFIFHVLEEEKEGDDGTKKAKVHTSSEWIMLQEQCDELAKEAARLAASVYVNSDKVRELAHTLTASESKGEDGAEVEFKDPLEEAARAMLALLKIAEEKLHAVGDQQTAKEIDYRKWELILSRLGVVDVSNQRKTD